MTQYPLSRLRHAVEHNTGLSTSPCRYLLDPVRAWNRPGGPWFTDRLIADWSAFAVLRAGVR
jgi:hypothetical protein